MPASPCRCQPGAADAPTTYTKKGVVNRGLPVSFFEMVGGGCPVRDFLEELKRTDPDDHRAVLAGLNKLKSGQNHREPLSKSLREGLFELRHVGKLNTRVIWFFREGRRIILVHGIRNKGQKISKADLETALSRMKDWNRRNPK